MLTMTATEVKKNLKIDISPGTYKIEDLLLMADNNKQRGKRQEVA